MIPESEVYRCPVCEKPFDREDRLFDFTIAAHEKDHRADRNGPSSMIQYDGASEMWACKLCGDPLHRAELSARMSVVTHSREKHGQAFGSSAPVTARGGRSKGSRSGFGRVADAVEDAVGAVIDGVGSALGKMIDP